MALSTRGKDEQTTKTFNVHTGVFPFKVVAFNPTLEELKKIGINFSDAPSYIGDDNFNEGKKQFKATFWLSNKPTKGYNAKGEQVNIKEGEIITALTFYISELDQISQNGDKVNFINKYGQTMFAESKEDLPDFFDSTGARVAKRGEAELQTFIFSYANLMANTDNQEGDENVLEDPNALFEDDSELRDTVEQLMREGNIVHCLVGLKASEGERGTKVTESIYPGFYGKHNQSSPVSFKSFIYASNVSEKNKQDKLNRRKPKFSYYRFEPTKLQIDEARELIEKHAEKPDKDGDQTESPAMADVDSDF